MNKEEAIEPLKDIINVLDFKPKENPNASLELGRTSQDEWKRVLDTVLNYIEKLENMYQKEHNEHMEMKRQNEVLRNNERILKEKIEELEKREIWSTATIEGLKEDFIPKQKIRDKIEELEEEDLEIYDTDSEDLIIAKYEQRAVLDFAQQLLNDKEEK